MKRTHIIIHHTAAWEKDFAQVKRYHVGSLGYRDVGYNYGIEYDGKIYNSMSALARELGMSTTGVRNQFQRRGFLRG